MGDHEVFALDWGVSLHTAQKVESDMTHVAIRGHWIRPAQEAGRNCVAFEAAEYVETTFEHQYLVRNRGWKKKQPSGGCARKKTSGIHMKKICRHICIFRRSI